MIDEGRPVWQQPDFFANRPAATAADSSVVAAARAEAVGDVIPPATGTRDPAGGVNPRTPGGSAGKRQEQRSALAQIDEMYTAPDPGVFSFMDADAATRAAAFQRLDRFVEWLVAAFGMSEVTACWREHPAMVLELWALERYYVAMFVESDNKSDPIKWVNQLASTRTRLRGEYRPARCGMEHFDPIGESAERVRQRRGHYVADFDVDQGTWARWAWPPVDDALQPVTAPEHVIRRDAQTEHARRSVDSVSQANQVRQQRKAAAGFTPESHGDGA
jgi:hypothetical protein